VPLAVLTVGVMLWQWFPLSALINQQSQLDATAAQITAVQSQSKALSEQSKSVSSTQEALALAREEYQLVKPGQSLIQVLPGSGSGKVTASSGDPGNQPLVSPTAAQGLTTSTSQTTSTHKSSFLSRVVRTLEFWR
jgi:hypothetical protein